MCEVDRYSNKRYNNKAFALRSLWHGRLYTTEQCFHAWLLKRSHVHSAPTCKLQTDFHQLLCALTSHRGELLDLWDQLSRTRATEWTSAPLTSPLMKTTYPDYTPQIQPSCTFCSHAHTLTLLLPNSKHEQKIKCWKEPSRLQHAANTQNCL